MATNYMFTFLNSEPDLFKSSRLVYYRKRAAPSKSATRSSVAKARKAAGMSPLGSSGSDRTVIRSGPSTYTPAGSSSGSDRTVLTSTPVASRADIIKRMESNDPMTKAKAVNEFNALGGATPAATTDDVGTFDPEAEGQASIEGENAATNLFAKKYGLNSDAPVTVEDQADLLKTRQLQDKKYQTEQQARQAALDRSQMATLKQQTEASVAGVTSQLAQGREGAMSEGAPQAVSQFRGTASKTLNEANTRLEAAQSQRRRAMVELERAQDKGQQDLARSLRAEIAVAAQEIRKAQAAADNEARQIMVADATIRKTNQETLAKTFSMMSPESILGMNQNDMMHMANESGVPYEQIANMQQQAALTQTIANSNDQLEVDKAQADLDKLLADEANWGKTDSPIELEYYKTLSDDDREIYNAQKGTSEYIEMKTLDADGNETITPGFIDPITKTFKPITGLGVNGDKFNSLEGIQAGVQDGELVVNTPPDLLASCGAGVNRTWGIAAGGKGGFSNTYASKKGVVDNNGVLSESITNPTSQLQAGMAFVMDTGDKWGHVGLVKSVNEDGSFNTVEWNADGAFRGSGTRKGPSNMTERTRQVDDVYGFAYPPSDAMTAQTTGGELEGLDYIKATEMVTLLTKGKGTTEYKELLMEQIAALKNDGNSWDDIQDKLEFANFGEGFAEYKGGTVARAYRSVNLGSLTNAQREAFEFELDNAVSSGDESQVEQVLKRTARSSAGTDEKKQVKGYESTSKLLDDIRGDLETYVAKNGDTGLFKGTFQQIKQKLGDTGDPELAKLGVRIANMIQTYRRSMSGVAFSVPESVEYVSMFPSVAKETLGSDADALQDGLNMALIDGLQENMNFLTDQFYSQAMGEANYDTIFKGVNPPSPAYIPKGYEAVNTSEGSTYTMKQQ